MINKPPPFKGLNIGIPIRGGGFINHGSGLSGINRDYLGDSRFLARLEERPIVFARTAGSSSSLQIHLPQRSRCKGAFAEEKIGARFF